VYQFSPFGGYAGRPWRPCSVARSGYETIVVALEAAGLGGEKEQKSAPSPLGTHPCGAALPAPTRNAGEYKISGGKS
jgi:hypothetical protein